MTWLDRLQTGSYTPQEGGEVQFDFEAVSKNFDLLGTVYNFPDALGSYVQRTGRSSKRYPLRIFFSGENHDLKADKFEKALLAKGIGELQHPFYGTFPAIPYGDVTRRDDLVTAANQTIIETTFYETIDAVYPRYFFDDFFDALDDFVDSVNDFLEEQSKWEFAAEREAFKRRFSSFLDGLDETLNGLTDKYKSARGDYDQLNQFFRQSKGGGKDSTKETLETFKNRTNAQTNKTKAKYNQTLESIKNSIDYLIANPKLLSAQLATLIRTPAKGGGNLSDTLAVYKKLILSQIEEPISEQSQPPAGSVEDSTKTNFFLLGVVEASLAIIAIIDALLVTEFTTRTQAIEAVIYLEDLYSRFNDWQEKRIKESDIVENGLLQQRLGEAIARAIGVVLEKTFTLKQERSFILMENRTPIDLCAELYGSVSNYLDFFCKSNDLSWNEQLEIQSGREIVYYQ